MDGGGRDGWREHSLDEPSTASKTLALQLETEALCGPEAEACTVLVTCHYRRLLRAIYGPGIPPDQQGGISRRRVKRMLMVWKSVWPHFLSSSAAC